jgi:hypothetical protein
LSGRAVFQYGGDIERAKDLLLDSGAAVAELIEILRPIDDKGRALDRDRKEAVRAFVRKVGGSGLGKKLFSVIGPDGIRRYKPLRCLALSELEKLYIEVSSFANLYDGREVLVSNRHKQVKIQIEMELRQRRLPFEEQIADDK